MRTARFLWLLIAVVPFTSMGSALAAPQPQQTQAVRASDFEFMLRSCRRIDVQVECDLDVVSLTTEIRHIVTVSKNHGAPSHPHIETMGYTLTVDPSGVERRADYIIVADVPSEKNGQTYRRVYPNTKARMKVIFANVPPGVALFKQFTLGLGVTLDFNRYTKVPVEFTDVAIAPSGNPAALEAPPVGAPGITAIPAEPFDVRLTGCTRAALDVICKVQMVASGSADTSLYALTRLDYDDYDRRSAPVPMSMAVDAEGREHLIDSATLGNQPSHRSGKTTWPVISGTSPVLTLTIKNVGLRTQQFVRLELGLAERQNRNLRKLPVVFRNVPIAGPSRAATATAGGAGDFLAQDWQIKPAACARLPLPPKAPAGTIPAISCSVEITNLADYQRILRLGSHAERRLRADGVSSAGDVYAATRVVVDTKDAWNPSDWPSAPGRSQVVRVIFENIPAAVQDFAKVSIATFWFKDGVDLPLPVSFSRVAIAPARGGR